MFIEMQLASVAMMQCTYI